MKSTDKKCLFAGISLQILLLLFGGAVYATPAPESAELLQNCHREIVAAVQKNLAGVEDLQVEGFADIDAWLSGIDADSQVLILKLGCWNRHNGVLPVQLLLSRSNGREARRWFKLRLRGRERVLLARRDLRRGEPVRSADFVSRLVDCQSLKREIVNFIPEKMVYQLTRNLKAGEPLPAKRLQPFRMVRRGELVHVVLDQGGIKVSTRGQAMGNGALQDIITVKNPTSKKYYQARVVGPGEVIVTY